MGSSLTECLGLVVTVAGATAIPILFAQYGYEALKAAAAANQQSQVSNQLALISLCLENTEAGLVTILKRQIFVSAALSVLNSR